MKLIKLIDAVSAAPFKKTIKPLNRTVVILRSVVIKVNTQKPRPAMTEATPSIKAKTSAVLNSGINKSDKYGGVARIKNPFVFVLI